MALFCLATMGLAEEFMPAADAANSAVGGRVGRDASTLGVVVYTPIDASPMETLAAREIRRYLYLRTGWLAPIETATNAGPARRTAIITARKDRALIKDLQPGFDYYSSLSELKPQQYLLKSLAGKNGHYVVLSGGDETGTLYAAYRFAEILGVRFYLHGDVLPDEPILGADSSTTSGGRTSMNLADWLRKLDLNETGKPLFALRGIQPFHDFPEGPDWWNQDDYQAILSQLPKLRMNFFGLHTYPEGGPNAEPAVWIGHPDDLEANGEVKFSYPASWQNTWRGNWGYQFKKTSRFTHGSAALFEREGFGSEAMFELCPQPEKTEAANEMFNRSAALLRAAFQQARALGIKTCVGTETPLTIPKKLQEQLKAKKLDPKSDATVQKLYEGMFQWIMRNYPLDYYWFWTPETWTWEGTKEDQVRATTNDLVIAMNAARAVNAPFQLATCGWVLGPGNNRALFDTFLPKSWPLSCINREVGKEPVEPGFARVGERPKWAIPWLEDDPALTSPQLWVGRMRQDAVDSLKYGCTGLLGIHWRTRVLGPSVSALAQAAWAQAGWQRPDAKASGYIGGKEAQFLKNEITGTEDGTVYRTVRYGMGLYRIAMPNGRCRVTLKFCEPHYGEREKRVFGVKLQGETVIDRLDLYAQFGKNKAVDYNYDNIQVANGQLDIEFVRLVENALIAAIVVESGSFVKKINCGGPAYKDFEADLPGLPRFQPTGDFYLDWALHEFGPAAAKEAAQVFERIDGNLPRPSDWVEGPGGIRPDTRPWGKVMEEYVFVDELESLQGKIQGFGQRERFNYWLGTFKYMKAMAHLNCVWGEFSQLMEQIKKEPDDSRKRSLARAQGMPIRMRLVYALGEVYYHLLNTLSNPGELGTLANWEQHLLPDLIEKPGAELARLLGEKLPDNYQPPMTYRGPLRVIVPTVRTSLNAGENFRLKIMILSQEPIQQAEFHWKPLGGAKYNVLSAEHVSRGVYSINLPAAEAGKGDFEYFVRVIPAKGTAVVFPATAPQQNQTIVMFPGPAGKE